jgi:hypothetical protein
MQQSTNIFTTIYKKAHDFECETGKKPTKVYLGSIELAIVQAEKDTLTKNVFCHLSSEQDNQPPKIGDLEVYEVNALYHLEVGL